MTDNNKIQASLTEQWRKGELPEGWYWVKIKTWCEYITMLYYTSDIFLDGDVPVDNDKIIEVLAPVPSYEEWQDLKSKLQLKETAYDFDTARLEAENARLKEQINKCCLDAINRGTANAVKAVKEFGMPERIKELVEQNAQLKERNKSLNNRDINLCRIANGIRDKNFALKELLKECREEINPYIEVIGGKKTFKNLIDKIDEVLK